MKTYFLFSGAAFALLGVALGAFGAHGLKHLVTSEMLAVFETAVRYQMYHSFGILFTALLIDRNPMMKYAGLFFTAGIILFSGSLYFLALTGSTSAVMITPVGGVSFLCGWGMMMYCVYKKKGEN